MRKLWHTGEFFFFDSRQTSSKPTLAEMTAAASCSLDCLEDGGKSPGREREEQEPNTFSPEPGVGTGSPLSLQLESANVAAVQWDAELEQSVQACGEKALGYKIMHIQSAVSLMKWHSRLMYVSMVAGPIGGLFAALILLLPQFSKTFSVLAAIVSFMSGVGVTAVKNGKYAQKSADHCLAAAKYASLAGSVEQQLVLPRTSRLNSGSYWIYVRRTYDTLFTTSPMIPPAIVGRYMRVASSNGLTTPDDYVPLPIKIRRHTSPPQTAGADTDGVEPLANTATTPTTSTPARLQVSRQTLLVENRTGPRSTHTHSAPASQDSLHEEKTKNVPPGPPPPRERFAALPRAARHHQHEEERHQHPTRRAILKPAPAEEEGNNESMQHFSYVNGELNWELRRLEEFTNQQQPGRMKKSSPDELV